jgi:hypothetical protein
MTVKELKEQCEKIINEGGENSPVYFNTESMCFDCHLVKIDSINYIAIDVIDSSGSAVLSYDLESALTHYNLKDDWK